MADATQLDALLEQSERTDIPLLLKAKEDAKKKVKDDPSPANLAALSRSKKMLDEAMSNQTDDKTLPNVKAVLEYLHKAGRKIGQAKLYNNINEGLLRKQPDASFKKRDVDRYATLLPLVSMPEAKTDENSDLAKEKMQVDIDKGREQLRSLALDRQIKAGKYIKRDEVALELASMAAALSLNLRSVFSLNVADYIRMVGGDISKAEQLAQEFENNLDMALNEYSKPMEFRTEIIVDESGEKLQEDKTFDGEQEQ
ncbi:MAG: hypothetical protein OSJ28_05880 [Desulfovibrio sp.]|nr:hypothetical protein [Desulfovibrio sp.]